MARRNIRGYTLIEALMIMFVLMAGISGIYLMLKPASLKAGIEKEQRNLSTLVSEVQGAFGRTQGTYTGLTVEKIQELRPQGLKFTSEENEDGYMEAMVVSRFNDTMRVRPAEVKRPGDAFDIVYQSLDNKQCFAFIKTFYPQSYGIYVGASEQSVQETMGVTEGRIAGDDVLLTACSTQEFKNGDGQLVFRFYEPMAFSAVATDLACGCTPETQSQDLPCGAGQSGVIRQERTSDCSGGTPQCPTPNWGAWTTTGNTCTGVATPMAAPVPVAPVAQQCVPGQVFQNISCAVGQTGQRTQRRNVTCPSPTGAPVFGAWVTVQNTCDTPSSATATCNMVVRGRSVACPVGQIGSIIERRTTTCATPFSSAVYGPWSEVSRSCRVACATANNCCQPLPDRTRALTCPAGNWGTGTERQNSWCEAATPTTPLAWSAWYLDSGPGCTACPAPATATEERWTPQGGAICPAGQYGTNTWESEEQRSQTTTYNCPAGTTALPPPTISAWTGWTPTGTTRNNTANTCTSCPANTSTVQSRWDPTLRSAPCPIGQVGSHTWEARQTRNQDTTYSCPAGTATMPTGTVTYSAWTDTGAIRNEVNTCAVPVCVEDGQPYTQWITENGTCPAGFTGSRSWEKEQSRTRTCSSPPAWDAWSAWTDVVGSTRNYVDTCVATGGTCQWNVVWDNTAMDAVSGPWESLTINSTTYCAHTPGMSNPVCNIGNYPIYAGDIARVENSEGPGLVHVDVEYEADPSCPARPAPTDCSVNVGAVFNWTVSGNACTYTVPAPGATVPNGTSYSANDTTAPLTGQAGFLCTAGVLSMTQNAGATCTAACTAPAPTNTTLYRAAPNETRTIACADGFTGSIEQERTRNEVGTETTTWSCPGPSPALTTTWSGTYANFGAWTTTSDTCVPTTGCDWDVESTNANPLGIGYSTYWRYVYTTSSGTNAGLDCSNAGGPPFPTTCGGSDALSGISGSFADANALRAVLPPDFDWMAVPDNEGLAPQSLAAPAGARIDSAWQIDGTGSGTTVLVQNASCTPPPPPHWQSMGAANGPEVSCTMADRYFEQWSNSSNAECHAVSAGGGNYKTACTGGTPAWVAANSNQMIGAGGLLIRTDPMLANSACTVGDQVDYFGCDGHSSSGTRVSESFECVP